MSRRSKANRISRVRTSEDGERESRRLPGLPSRGEANKLEVAAENAHRLTEALAQTRGRSLRIPRPLREHCDGRQLRKRGNSLPDGRIDLSPEVYKIMQTYGAERSDCRSRVRRCKPRTLDGIRFDVQPHAGQSPAPVAGVHLRRRQPDRALTRGPAPVLGFQVGPWPLRRGPLCCTAGRTWSISRRARDRGSSIRRTRDSRASRRCERVARFETGWIAPHDRGGSAPISPCPPVPRTCGDTRRLQTADRSRIRPCRAARGQCGRGSRLRIGPHVPLRVGQRGVAHVVCPASFGRHVPQLLQQQGVVRGVGRLRARRSARRRRRGDRPAHRRPARCLLPAPRPADAPPADRPSDARSRRTCGRLRRPFNGAGEIGQRPDVETERLRTVRPVPGPSCGCACPARSIAGRSSSVPIGWRRSVMASDVRATVKSPGTSLR